MKIENMDPQAVEAMVLELRSELATARDRYEQTWLANCSLHQANGAMRHRLLELESATRELLTAMSASVTLGGITTPEVHQAETHLRRVMGE